MVSSAYLRLLIFLPAVLIPVCKSSSSLFLMIYSTFKLNKQGNSIQPWHTCFPILNQSVVSCQFLIVPSWPAYRFLRRQVRWSGIPVSLRIFHSFPQFVLHIVKGFSVVNEIESEKWKCQCLSRVWLFATSWDFPDKNTGMGCCFILQRIFPTQGSNLGLPHCRQILYCLSHQGSPNEAEVDDFLEFSCNFMVI